MCSVAVFAPFVFATKKGIDDDPRTVQWGIEESKVTCRMSEQQQDGAVSDD